MKKYVAMFGSSVLLIMIGCSGSSDDTPPPTPPDTPSSAARTDDLLNAMTLDEKIQQIANRAFLDRELPGCGFTAVGRQIEGIPRLAIPTFRQINGGNGVRGGACLPE